MIDQATRSALQLITIEDFQPDRIWSEYLAPGLRDEVSADALYSRFVDMHVHIPSVNCENAWKYLRDIHNLTEWTVSLRDLELLSADDNARRFKARDVLMPIDDVFGEFRVHEASHSVDLRLGESFDSIWLTQTISAVDSLPRNGREGTTILWTFFRHIGFDRNVRTKDFWTYLPSMAALARKNLIKILEFHYLK